jgi:hypothetical protein
MKLIYASGFSKTEKLEWKPVVFNNIIQSMRVIFEAMADFDIDFEDKDNEVSDHMPIDFRRSRSDCRIRSAAMSSSWQLTSSILVICDD